MLNQSIENVARIYEEDRRNNPVPRTRDDIPISYEAITPEWLTAVLCADRPGTAVTSSSLGPPDDGTSGRRRIFVEYNTAGRNAGLPPTVFGKASQELIHRISYAMNLSYARESNFYNIVRPQVDIETPRSYFANFSAETFNSIVLLEDIGETTTFCTEHTPISHEEAHEMVRLLADLHAPFTDPQRFATVRGNIDTWNEHWDAIMRNGMAEFTEKGFVAAEKVIPPRLFARVSEFWPAVLASARRHLDLPATFNHGDTHFANWYKRSDGRMGLSDWQGCALGHWSRDLVYALSTSLTVENRRAWERGLLETYLERWAERGLGRPMSFDDTWLNYRQQSMSALAYWTTTFTPPPGMPENMQPKDRALIFIERLAAAVDDLEALDSF